MWGIGWSGGGVVGGGIEEREGRTLKTSRLGPPMMGLGGGSEGLVGVSRMLWNVRVLSGF